jgi:hypothetical protein
LRHKTSPLPNFRQPLFRAVHGTEFGFDRNVI